MPAKKTIKKSTRKPSRRNFLKAYSKFSIRKLALYVSVVASLGIVNAGATFAASATPPPRPISCTTSSPHHVCQFWTTAPVYTSSWGYQGNLSNGPNWVVCQQSGYRVYNGVYHNYWWAYTESNQLHYGWVNGVYAKTGDNDGRWGNVPTCSSGYGRPPQSAPPGSGGGGGSTATHQSWMHSAGISSSNYGHVDYIVSHESGWRTNAQNASGAYGLCQALPGSKMSSFGSDWRTNPITQLRWCNSYARSRYGSSTNDGWANAESFWRRNGWW